MPRRDFQDDAELRPFGEATHVPDRELDTKRGDQHRGSTRPGYPADDEGLPDYEAGIATHEFLRVLSEYIAPDAELDVQTAGYTKCRFPVHAQRYVVRENEVLHANLQSHDLIEE